jgi:hypothetical protein
MLIGKVPTQAANCAAPPWLIVPSDLRKHSPHVDGDIDEDVSGAEA